ncbi:MAG: multiheme c-type cytochrome [Anaerolineae bacterium]|nr:hypothetical protein [Anaerolineae bacterium]
MNNSAPSPTTTSDSVVPTKQPLKSRRRWVVIGLAAFLVLVLLGGVGFVTASVLEEQDAFCTSCHTVPETTYFNRAYIALDHPSEPVNDLATSHYIAAQQEGGEPFKCINCHRGDASPGHRVSTLTLAGRDAIIYLLGRENPAIEKVNIAEAWLPNAACVSCHTETLLALKGIDNHFHTHLPQAAEALAKGGTLTVASDFRGSDSDKDALLKAGLGTVSGVDLLCTSCHLAHKALPGGASQFFMDADMRNAACVDCHVVAGQGPQSVRDLGSK